MNWYTVTELKTPTDQHVLFDGKASEEEAIAVMVKAHSLTGSRVIVTKGRNFGKFVAEIVATNQ
jgi:hypothetical protein